MTETLKTWKKIQTKLSNENAECKRKHVFITYVSKISVAWLKVSCPTNKARLSLKVCFVDIPNTVKPVLKATSEYRPSSEWRSMSRNMQWFKRTQHPLEIINGESSVFGTSLAGHSSQVWLYFHVKRIEGIYLHCFLQDFAFSVNKVCTNKFDT